MISLHSLTAPVEALLGPAWPVVWTLAKIVVIAVPLILSVAYLTLAERKVIGWMQVRIGPNRVGPLGLLQPFADVFKLLFKEIIVPAGASRYLFFIAPMLALAPALAAWAVIPFADGIVLADVNAGLLYLLAMTSMGVYGIILAGWASNSKYAFLGCLRSAAQIVSYEIAMGFALVGVLMAATSLNLSDIVHGQDGGAAYWYVWPLFPLFVVYLVSGIAETNRHPFDVAEGESEIVAGFHVEYSGVTFALFFLAEYMNMILIAALTSIMFLGGWLAPWPQLNDVEIFGFHPLGDGLPWLFAKTCAVLFIFLWIRATWPRYRYDQIMRLGWKVFIPVTLVWIVFLGAMMQTPLGGVVPLRERVDARTREGCLRHLAPGRAGAGPDADRAAHVRAQDHGAVPGREDADEPALPRVARAAPLSERRGAVHRLQAVRGGLPGARHHDRIRAARRRHAPDDALRHRSREVHFLRLLRGELPGRLDRRDARARIPRREARRSHLHEGHAAGRRRPLRGADRRGPSLGREVSMSAR